MQGDKLRWWPIYNEPDHELVGRIQLLIHYSTSLDENSLLKVHTRHFIFLSEKSSELQVIFVGLLIDRLTCY